MNQNYIGFPLFSVVCFLNFSPYKKKRLASCICMANICQISGLPLKIAGIHPLQSEIPGFPINSLEDIKKAI